MPWCALSLQAPLRMEMKGVCNEFHSARVPDPTAISQLRGENQRDRERVERRGSEMEGRRGSRGNTELFLFFTPPSLVPGCQAATMLSWPFFQSIENSVGPSHREGEERGMVLRGECWKEEGERWRRMSTVQQRTGEMIGLNREQRERLYFQHEHMGDENTCCRTMTTTMMTKMTTTAASIIDIIPPPASSSYGETLALLCSHQGRMQC